MILVILQNAHGVEDGYIPTYKRESFKNCYTGKRLAEMLPTLDVEIRNATPKIGDMASSFIKADLCYLQEEINKIQPKVILACGSSAQSAVDNINTNAKIIKAPHPAWRQLSKLRTAEIKRAVEMLL